MFKVLIPQDIHQDAKDYLLAKGYEIQVGPAFDAETIRREVPEFDALIVRTAPYDQETIEAGKKLQIIARHGVGVDNIDLEQAKKQGLWVTIATGANVTSVAEHTITLMLAAAKKMKQFDDATRQNNFAIRNQIHGSEVYGKKLGLIGLGAIGKKVAEIAAKGFGMEILAFDVYKPTEIPEYVTWIDSLEDVLTQADIVTVHVPLTPETKDLISKESMSGMKDGVIIVNCARGGIVNEQDLVEMIQNGKVSAAAFDVFVEEPPRADHPFFALDQVIMTPHNAALTDEAARAMAMSCAIAVDDVLNGRRPQYPIVEP